MNWKVGEQLTPLKKGPIQRQRMVEWCAAENDYYHLHYDERFAAKMGFPAPPVQGTYKLALVGAMLERWAAGKARLTGVTLSYRRPDIEGTTLTVQGRVTAVHDELVEVEIWVDNEKGDRTADGRATLLLA